MYIDIALTPLEESIVLTTLFTLVLLVLVLLFRPRLVTRGLAPVLALVAGDTARRRRSRGVSVSVGDGRVTTGSGPGDLIGLKGGSSSSLAVVVDPLTNKQPNLNIPHILQFLTLHQTRRTILNTYLRWTKIIQSNPEEFGAGWMGIWPIPTWGVWTTYGPALESLGRMFEVELRVYGGEVRGREVGKGEGEGLVGHDREDEDGQTTTTLKERKGSVGLGIVGVDVITPLTTPLGENQGVGSNDTSCADDATGGMAGAVLATVVVPAEIQSQVGLQAGGSRSGSSSGTGLATTTTITTVLNAVETTTESPKSVFRFSEGYDMSSPPRRAGNQGSGEVRGQGMASTTTTGTMGNKMKWMSDPYAQGRMDGIGFRVDGDEHEHEVPGHEGVEGGYHSENHGGSSSFPTGSPRGGVIAEHSSGSFSTAGLEFSPGTIGPGGMGSFKTSSGAVTVESAVGGGPGRPHRRSRSFSRNEPELGVLSPSKMNKVLEDEEEVVVHGSVVPSLRQSPLLSSLPPQQPQLIPFTPFPDRIERSRSRRTRRWLVSKGKRTLVFSYARLAGPVGLCGVVAVVGMVMWETTRCWSIIAKIVWAASVSSGEGAVGEANPLVKRGMTGLGEMSAGTTAVGTTGPPSQEGLLRAIIPGWTVPLSHIFPIVGTLIACQVIHESGHVIAAAMDSITPTRLGLNLHLIIPAASVTFPKTVSDLGSTSRLRMAASGPWNNLLTWIVLTLIASTRLWTFIYHDYSDQGRVVLDVNFRSALSGHIPVGSIVEYLDDTPLRGEPDNWSDYLWNDVFDETRGWCIDKKRYLASQKAPCPPAAPVQFTSLPSNATDASIQCLPPYPLLTSRTWSCPCSSPLKICVKPLASENIMRIQWRDARAGVGGLMTKEEEVESIVVLWSGDKREVWDSVKVSRWAGRGGLIGRWVFGWIELVFGYTAMVSLSLALLNSLPLPRLDGAHMVEAVLDRLYPTTSKARLPVSPELAAGEMTEDQGEKGLVDAISNGTERLEPGAAIVSRRRNIERGIEFGVIGLTTLMLGGQVLVWVL